MIKAAPHMAKKGRSQRVCWPIKDQLVTSPYWIWKFDARRLWQTTRRLNVVVLFPFSSSRMSIPFFTSTSSIQLFLRPPSGSAVAASRPHAPGLLARLQPLPPVQSSCFTLDDDAVTPPHAAPSSSSLGRGGAGRVVKRVKFFGAAGVAT